MGGLGRLLIVVGITLAVVGIVILLIDRAGWLGRFPGDIVVRRKNWTFWIPLTTCLALSVLLTLIFNLLRRR
jgi:hypothetical protein